MSTLPNDDRPRPRAVAAPPPVALRAHAPAPDPGCGDGACLRAVRRVLARSPVAAPYAAIMAVGWTTVGVLRLAGVL